ncbi:MAG: hypothetical protein IIW33_01775 [Oscillospiraceae bacterium]|nr:hypothetical protein [Oscillospiraceae bacterium]
MVICDGKEIKESLRFLNRVSECEGYPVFEWSASGFEMRFFGDRLFLTFEKGQTEQPIYAVCEIDGVRRDFTVSESGGVFRALDLGGGEHFLRFLRLSEPRLSDSDARLILKEVRIDGENAEILEKPCGKSRKIAFFGDSITCGYGVLDSGESSVFKTCYQDATKTYAFKTINAFDADFQIVAQSGQGVVCCVDKTAGYRVSEYFEHNSRYLRDQYDHSSFTPDVIVLNIGTNDNVARVEKETFTKGACALLEQVRSRYPEAEIVWMYGLMGGYIGEAACDAVELMSKNDSKLHFLKTPCISRAKDEVGAVGHPNEKGQQMGADLLIPLISEITGWQLK